MQLSIRPLMPDDLSGVFALWNHAFHDEIAYIGEFARTADPCRHGLGAFTETGRLAGMLYALPGVLSLRGNRYTIRYLYAVATQEAWRRQGVFRALHAQTERRACGEGAHALILVPADAGLYELYRNFGYRTRFFTGEFRVAPMLSPRAALSPCGAEQFAALRQDWLEQSGSFCDLDPTLHGFRYYDIQADGGEIWLARTPDGDGYVVGKNTADGYRAAETSLQGAALAHAAGAICRATGARCFYAKGRHGVRTAAGMIRTLSAGLDPSELMTAGLYMNLMLNGV